MKNIVKSLFAIITILVTILLVIGCEENIVVDNYITNTDYIASENFTFNIGITSQSRLRVEGISGNVTVTGGSIFNSVLIIGEKKVGSESYADAELHLSELNIVIFEQPEEIIVKTSQPKNSQGRNYVVDYVIVTPANFEVSVQNINGNIKIDSINNSLQVNNINGSINLNNITGSTTVSLVNGQIKSQQILPIDESISISNSNGSIELFIPMNTSSEFIASSVNGIINLSNLVLKNYVNLTNTIRGTLGEGRGMIELGTTNGSIYVKGY